TERIGQQAYLPHDFAGAQVTDESHLPGQAERAGHGTADLGRDAECHCGGVRYKDGLDIPAIGKAEEKLLRAVARPLALEKLRYGDGKLGREHGTQLAGQIGHRLDIRDTMPINPAEYLPRAEALDTARLKQRLQRRSLQLRQVPTARLDGYGIYCAHSHL